MKSAIKRWTLTGVLSLALLTGLGSFKFIEVKAAIDNVAAMPEYSETVEVVSPRAVEYTPSITALGVVLAPQQVVLRNELPGYITEVNFVSGATVKKGDVIVQLDISEQQANLASAKARAKLAQSLFNRETGLLKSSAVSEDAVERAESELAVAKADIKAIQSIIKRRTIRAPFDGVIGIHQLEAGQFLSSNTEIAPLVGHSENMWIDFSVPQFYGALKVGTAIKGEVVSTTSSDESFNAVIIAGNSGITAESRSRLYRASVNKAAGLLHNTAVKIDVPVGNVMSVFAVPSTSVQTGANGKFIYALDPEPDSTSYRARQLPVEVVNAQEGLAYVSAEIGDNIKVSGAGAFKLNEGLLVHSNSRPLITPISQAN
ncbi:efflux RND transporter periplasmic adaptor subunit [Pleionea sp. CnH1-48]|uniref:efflux RND transporter periplasmic adaptor subunit n=1 Tax=Pleionea sp. CnH1-48 TaxID=2954494 RepID=UPI0020986499|nr:efflux RND transporter periplasmic adaptor subunit [Pleionea sp. CnH1-48]MCO7223225.1 efflux RND transporter periplasmic adaptor subunit [Pleionea sp. CnH1-48]